MAIWFGTLKLFLIVLPVFESFPTSSGNESLNGMNSALKFSPLYMEIGLLITLFLRAGGRIEIK